MDGVDGLLDMVTSKKIKKLDVTFAKKLLALLAKNACFAALCIALVHLLPIPSAQTPEARIWLNTQANRISARTVEAIIIGLYSPCERVVTAKLDGDFAVTIARVAKDGSSDIGTLTFEYDNLFGLGIWTLLMLAFYLAIYPPRKVSLRSRLVSLATGTALFCSLFLLRAVFFGLLPQFFYLPPVIQLLDSPIRCLILAISTLFGLVNRDDPKADTPSGGKPGAAPATLLALALPCLMSGCIRIQNCNVNFISIGGNGENTFSFYIMAYLMLNGSFKTISDLCSGFKVLHHLFHVLRQDSSCNGKPPNAIADEAVQTIARAVHDEIRPDLEDLKQETRQVGKKADGARKSITGKLNILIGFQKVWKAIFGKLFKYQKKPMEDVADAMEDRYAGINWEHFQSKDRVRQIKDVIDYTYDVQAITLDVSEKHYKKASGGNGINLADACRATAELHEDEWSQFKDPYPTEKALYVACHDLANRKRGKCPFKLA